MAIFKHRIEDEKVFKFDQNVKTNVIATENIAMAEVIIDSIKDYGIMHSSNIINESLIKATRMGLEPMSDYFDSRLKKVSHTFESSTQKPMKDARLMESPTFGDYG